jgi:pilus assembly protein Flp/PilA
MLKLYVTLQSLIARREEKGATATEYALLVAFIAIVIVVAVTAFGNNLNGFFARIANRVGSWAP